MEQIKAETPEQYKARLLAACKTLTQDQVEACAWAMGGSGVGWTPSSIAKSIEGQNPASWN